MSIISLYTYTYSNLLLINELDNAFVKEGALIAGGLVAFN